MTKRHDLPAPATAEAITLSLGLLAAKHAALSFVDAETGTPGISRIAFGSGPEGGLMTLISSLAPHSAGLAAHPACAILLGEPGAKGDPLTHPRLMLRAQARFVAADAGERPFLRAHWLKGHPKAALYIDFSDFAFVRFAVTAVLLNGGFGKAWHIAPADLGLPG